MPPQALRYPSPAPVDVAETGGRHRRPESLADVHRRRLPLDDVLPARHSRAIESRVAVPLPRTARHRPAATDAARARRHAAAHRAAVTRRPVTGSHRAPGTLPIESWLLMGKKRQQVLLASLVAVGLLLVALPTERGPGNVNTVNAAAQRAAEAQAAKKNPAKDPARGDNQAGGGREGGAPAPAASAPASPPDARATGAAQHTGTAGPGNSLRTTGSKAVALTFDDGPDPEQTPRILALLDEYQVKATFCLVGEQVQKHPEIVRQIVAAGHTLCNHTWNHSLTIGEDKTAQIRDDLARTNAAIEAAVPGVAVPFFRAPGGNFTDRLVAEAGAEGMTSLYWQVDPQDWDHRTGETDAAHVARIIATVKKHVQPGSIVLSHDFNQPDTIEAYEKLLPWLTEHFTLGIPGRPAPPESTPPTAEPTPTETPATPDPSATATPAPGEAAAEEAAVAAEKAE